MLAATSYSVGLVIELNSFGESYMTADDEDFFTKTGTTLDYTPAENLLIGQVYPIYGMITQVLADEPEGFRLRVNDSIDLVCNIGDPANIEKVKSRAFEPGIFVTEITSIEPLQGRCTTIVFGRPSAAQA
jgi:hypothetical protein